MPLLLDTHTLVWFIEGDRRLPSRTRDLIADETVYVSEVSPWELVLKAQSRQIPYPYDMPKIITEFDFHPLPLNFGVHQTLLKLPMLHTDPYDRVIVAQAIHEGLTLVTRDKRLRQYDVAKVW